MTSRRASPAGTLRETLAIRAPWPCVCGHDLVFHDWTDEISRHNPTYGHCLAAACACKWFVPPITAERKKREAARAQAREQGDGVLGIRMMAVAEISPVPKGRARVVVRDGKVHTYTPEATVTAEAALGAAWKAINRGLALKVWPPQTPLRLTVTFVLARPKSAPKDRLLPSVKPDLDNYAKTLDGLNGIAFHDDAQATTMLLKKRYAEKGTNPRIEIEVEEDDGS